MNGRKKAREKGRREGRNHNVKGKANCFLVSVGPNFFI